MFFPGALPFQGRLPLNPYDSANYRDPNVRDWALGGVRRTVVAERSPTPVKVPIAEEPGMRIPRPTVGLPPEKAANPIRVSGLLGPILRVYERPSEGELLTRFFDRC